MLKEVITACLPTITCIVNMSLTRGDFITDWKLAIVIPLLKKPGSKPLHKTTGLSQTYPSSPSWLNNTCYDSCTQHNLIPDFQSAYHKNHSTETSLLKMTNNILWGFENQNITSAVILNLSAAYDTIDHNILLTIFHDHFGIWVPALSGLKNYF